jgi:hypothetical protein
MTSLHRTTLTSRRMVLTLPSSRHINRATSTHVKSLATCRFALTPVLHLFAPMTFERLDHLFAGLDNVADEGNIPTERSTTNILDQRLPAPPAPSAILILDNFGNMLNERSATNILDQNLPVPTAKPTVNDFANATDAVAWMNEHKQCLFCGKGFATLSKLVRHIGAHRMIPGISINELRAATERTPAA